MIAKIILKVLKFQNHNKNYKMDINNKNKSKINHKTQLLRRIILIFEKIVINMLIQLNNKKLIIIFIKISIKIMICIH